jgi:hypothetical protein
MCHVCMYYPVSWADVVHMSKNVLTFVLISRQSVYRGLSGWLPSIFARGVFSRFSHMKKIYVSTGLSTESALVII